MSNRWHLYGTPVCLRQVLIITPNGPIKARFAFLFCNTQVQSLVDHGLHVGLVVPAGELQRHLPELKEGFPVARFMEVGWGDRAFSSSRQHQYLLEAAVGIAEADH